MRITQRAVAYTSLRGLNGNLAAVNKLQQQLTSGTTISKPSDDPTGTNTSMVTRQGMAGLAQQARNITDGTAFLDATDSALQTMLAQIHNVRALTVQALNAGSMSGASAQAIATQVKGLRESLIGQANQVVQGRPIFGGVTNGSQAYNPVDGAYVGVGGTATRAAQPLNCRVSDVEEIRLDITGPEAFGEPTSGKDLFGVIDRIVADVSDPTALATDLGNLDAVFQRVTTALADIGTRSARMEAAQTANSAAALSLKAKLSSNEDVDMPKTIMELQMQQTGYQAALSATAKALQPSLVDFLR